MHAVEAMPGQENPDFAIVSINRGRHTDLAVPEYTAHRPNSPTRSRPRSVIFRSPGSERHRKRKSVRWDPNIVGNDHEVQSRNQKSIPLDHVMKSSPNLTEQSLGSTFLASNMLEKIDPLLIGQPSSYAFEEIRRLLSPSLPEHSRAQDDRPAPTAAAANPAFRRVKSPSLKMLTKIQEPPPAVPDAPRAHRPPPAPRPARLPTPELPEVEEAKFFVPKDKPRDHSRVKSNPRERPVHLKMDKQRKEGIVLRVMFC